MIVKMSRVYVAVSGSDRDRLLKALREMGVLHLTPVDPQRAVAEEKTVDGIAQLDRAQQMLSNFEPTGTTPDIPPLQGAQEVLHLQRLSNEGRSRLSTLYRQLQQQSIWGDVRIEQFEQLKTGGIEPQFFSVPNADLEQIQGELVHVVTHLPGKRSLVAVINRSGQLDVPESADPIPVPARDCPSIRAEAAEIDAKLKQNARQLTELAHLVPAMREKLRELRSEAQYTVADRGGLSEEHIYAVQGWAPSQIAETLADELEKSDLHAAVQSIPPAEDEEPPTLISYPRWVKPIKGLFDILGTFPGYAELDLSAFFMIALPLFAAILIGDAGYGLIFLAFPLLMYRKLIKAAGPAKTHLLIVIGAVTIAWGILTANYFGVTPKDLMAWGGFDSVQSMRAGSGFWAALGKITCTMGVLWRFDEEAGRFLIIKLSFILGSIHLILAHLRQAVGYFPDQKSLSELGWCAVLAGMLGVVWKLFTFPIPPWLLSAALILLIAGYVLAVLFAYPGHRIPKRIGFGFASSLLPLIGAFGDIMSYIRLMAVGLASYYIASAFNGLGAMVGQMSPPLWIVGAVIILFGHSLNIGMAVIAIFAHGVRLNMLEFSNNAGVQWAGYPYQPFTRQYHKET